MTSTDLPGRLRSTTEQMANRCSVDAHLWDVHSNAVLEAADEIERLRYKNEWLTRRLAESVTLFSVLLRDECVAERYREDVLAQLQDNMKALSL